MAIGEVTAKNIGAIFATVRELVSTDKPFYQPWSQIAQPHQVEPIWTCPSARLPHPQRECTWGHLQPGNCPYCGVELEHRSLRVWLLQCGRSGGKSRTGAEWITDRARRFPGTRWAAIGIHARHVRSVLGRGGERRRAGRDLEQPHAGDAPSQRRTAYADRSDFDPSPRPTREGHPGIPVRPCNARYVV